MLLAVLLIVLTVIIITLYRRKVVDEYRYGTFKNINKINILMIGNSFIYKNHMYKTLQKMLGDAYDLDILAKPAFSLKRHLESPELNEVLSKKQYQYIVLQEKSIIPIKYPERLDRDVAAIITHISKYQRAWIPVIYETYGRCYLKDPNPLETQTRLNDLYRQTANFNRARLAKVGEAFMKFRLLDDYEVTDNILYKCTDKDHLHPSKMGSILTAMVFYKLITGKNIPSIGNDPILTYFENIVNTL